MGKSNISIFCSSFVQPFSLELQLGQWVQIFLVNLGLWQNPYDCSTSAAINKDVTFLDSSIFGFEFYAYHWHNASIIQNRCNSILLLVGTGGAAWRIGWCILVQPFLPHLFFDLHSLKGCPLTRQEKQSAVHCVFDSLLNGTFFNSVFPLTDKIFGFFSGTPLIRTDSFPFFEGFALIYIPKIGVEFGFHSLSDEIAHVLYLRYFSFFPNIGGHTFN